MNQDLRIPLESGSHLKVSLGPSPVHQHSCCGCSILGHFLELRSELDPHDFELPDLFFSSFSLPPKGACGDEPFQGLSFVLMLLWAVLVSFWTASFYLTKEGSLSSCIILKKLNESVI